MIIKPKTFIALLLILVLPSSSIAQANSQDINSYRILQGAPESILNSSYLTSATKSIWETDTDFKLCNSVDSAECNLNEASENQWFGAYLSLPKCESSRSQWCISELLQYSDGRKTSLKFIKYSSNSHIWSQSKIGLPEGKSASIWKNENTDELFTINSRLSARYSPYYEDKFKISDFTTTIQKVELRSDLGILSEMLIPRIESDILGAKQLVSSSVPDKCVWASPGECGVISEMNLNSKLVLTLNLGNEVGGWFDGRLGSPSISSKKLGNNQNQLRIEANPISVAEYDAQVEINKVPSELKKYDPRTQFSGGIGNFANDSDFQLFNLWTTLVNNKSSRESRVWNFSSITSNNNLKCLNSTKEVLGIVTTNSTIFQGRAPDFKNGSLIYQVGAPHLSASGAVLQGYYYLNIRKDVAKCLYGFSKTPTNAKVQIQNINGSTYVATSTLKESNGWLNLIVSGFTYSTPKILISFPKKR